MLHIKMRSADAPSAATRVKNTGQGFIAPLKLASFIGRPLFSKYTCIFRFTDDLVSVSHEFYFLLLQNHFLL
jgi:hypothetical protein